MRRLMLTVVMVLMGAAMAAGSARALFGNALLPLDLEIGTNSSAAAAVLGIGMMAAAIHPANNIAWVRAESCTGSSPSFTSWARTTSSVRGFTSAP